MNQIIDDSAEIYCLGESPDISDEDLERLYMTALHSTNNIDSCTACYSLAQQGEKSLTYLAQLLGSTIPRVAEYTIEALHSVVGEWGKPLEGAIRRYLISVNSDIRGMSIAILTTIANDKGAYAIELCEMASNTSDIQLINLYVGMIGQIEPPPVVCIPQLLKLRRQYQNDPELCEFIDSRLRWLKE